MPILISATSWSVRLSAKADNAISKFGLLSGFGNAIKDQWETNVSRLDSEYLHWKDAKQFPFTAPERRPLFCRPAARMRLQLFHFYVVFKIWSTFQGMSIFFVQEEMLKAIKFQRK